MACHVLQFADLRLAGRVELPASLRSTLAEPSSARNAHGKYLSVSIGIMTERASWDVTECDATGARLPCMQGHEPLFGCRQSCSAGMSPVVFTCPHGSARPGPKENKNNEGFLSVIMEVTTAYLGPSYDLTPA